AEARETSGQERDAQLQGRAFRHAARRSGRIPRQPERRPMKAVKYVLILIVLASPLASFAQVSYQRVVKSDGEPANWLTYGGNYYDQRFSGLTQLTPQNVAGRRGWNHVRHGAAEHGDGARRPHGREAVDVVAHFEKRGGDRPLSDES